MTERERPIPDTDPSPRGDGARERGLDDGRIPSVMDQPPRPRRRDIPAIPPAPALPSRLESEGPAADPLSPPPTLGPFGLDPVFADAISRVISDAITAEMERVRISLAPPSTAPTTPAPAPTGDGKPASEPPRSSIRVAAKKAPRWVSYAVTFLAVAGQLIVWFGPRLLPQHAGPLAQALKIIGWFLQSLGGTAGPPPDLTP